MSKSFCTIKVRPKEVEHKFNIEIRSAYNADFIHALKKSIPLEDREWNEDSRRWFTTDFYLSDVCDLAREYYDEATLIQGDVSTNLHTGHETVQERLF